MKSCPKSNKSPNLVTLSPSHFGAKWKKRFLSTLPLFVTFCLPNNAEVSRRRCTKNCQWPMHCHLSHSDCSTISRLVRLLVLCEKSTYDDDCMIFLVYPYPLLWKICFLIVFSSFHFWCQTRIDRKFLLASMAFPNYWPEWHLIQMDLNADWPWKMYLLAKVQNLPFDETMHLYLITCANVFLKIFGKYDVLSIRELFKYTWTKHNE